MDMTIQQIQNKIKKLEEHIEEVIPNFKLLEKRDSFLMKFISFFLKPFNKNFLTHYVTTFYPNVYYPFLERDKKNNNKYVNGYFFSNLAHEYVHLKDRKKWWLLFNFLYLMPQIFSLLALLSFFNLWCLFFLLFLLPFPSIGRMIIEKRGFTMSWACSWWIFDREENVENYINIFCGSDYYFMFPFRSFMRKQFEKEIKKIKQKDFSFEQLKEVHDIIVKE